MTRQQSDPLSVPARELPADDPGARDLAPTTSSTAPAPAEERQAGRRRQGGGRRRRRRDDIMVPDVEFSSYYGRQIVKTAPWEWPIPAYLYTGGLAASSGLIAAGAELTGRRELQRNARIVALGALGASTAALVGDLGRPKRFLNMMRTVKLTSPMSVGSWILAGYGAFTGLAAASEVGKLAFPGPRPWDPALPVVDRLASLGAGAFAAPLAAYTAVLLSNTATPTWHGIYRELPFVFVGSALAAGAGAALVTTSPEQTGPARRIAVGGTALELAAMTVMEGRAGVVGEPLHVGRPGAMLKAAKGLMLGGAALAALGGRSRAAGVVGGIALNVGSALTRFGVFEAGQNSTKDPKYVVVPQRQRLQERRRAAAAELAAQGRGQAGPLPSP